MSSSPPDPEQAVANTARATITPYRDGPYLVRGDFQLLDHDGAPIPMRRKTIALCRCGRSRIAPFCDGTHAVTGFRTGPGPGPDPGDSSAQPPPQGPPPR